MKSSQRFAMEGTENAGLFYTVTGLLPLAVCIEFLRPVVNDTEEQYLKQFIKQETIIVALSPIIMLALLGLNLVLSFGTLPPFSIYTAIYLFIVFWYFPGYTHLPKTDEEGGIRHRTIRNVILGGYLIFLFSIHALICALTGPITFQFSSGSPVYRFPSQQLPPKPDIWIVDKNGNDYVLVDFQLGYLTYLLYTYAPNSIFFFSMFYLSHFYLTALFRYSFYVVFFVIESITQAVNWLRK